MKKLIIILSLSLLIGSIFSFSACYAVDSAPMSKLVGTYMLTENSTFYTGKFVINESATKEYLPCKDVVSYIIIDGSSFGYVVYKDSETPLIINRVKITYSYDADDPGCISYIEYKSGYSSERTVLHTCRLAFNSSGKTLNRHMPALNNKLEIIYTDNIVFKRVNSATDLSYVKKQFGNLPVIADYALCKYDGIYSKNIEENDEYIYYFCAISAINKSVDVYYMRKSDNVSVSFKNQPVTYVGNGEEEISTISFYGKTFDMPWIGCLHDVNVVEDENAGYYYYVSGNIDELIKNAKDIYDNSTDNT